MMHSDRVCQSHGSLTPRKFRYEENGFESTAGSSTHSQLRKPNKVHLVIVVKVAQYSRCTVERNEMFKDAIRKI